MLQVISRMKLVAPPESTATALPVIDSGSPNIVVAQEREVLALLLDTALGRGGNKRHVANAGRCRMVGSETYADVMVLDRRISEIRARIAWFQAAARGVAMPGNVLW